MAKEQSAQVPSNPGMIEWPRDEYGVSSALKAAIVQAAGAVNGQSDKLAVILEVLSIGIKHAKARYAAQVEINTNRLSELAGEQEVKAKLHNQHGNSRRGYQAF